MAEYSSSPSANAFSVSGTLPTIIAWAFHARADDFDKAAIDVSAGFMPGQFMLHYRVCVVRY
jgi:hypothetical protein